jgi:hypothetical protein
MRLPSVPSWLRWRTDGFHIWVCLVSAALWLLWTFSIPLSDFLSILLAFALFGLALLFLGAWAWSIVYGRREKLWLPFVVSSVSAVLLVAVPWPWLYADANFWLMLPSRREIIRRVQADDYWEDRSNIKICRAIGSNGKHPVVFYLNRGFLDHLDAYVYVPTETITPAELSTGLCVGAPPRSLKPYGRNPGWFRVVN